MSVNPFVTINYMMEVGPERPYRVTLLCRASSSWNGSSSLQVQRVAIPDPARLAEALSQPRWPDAEFAIGRARFAFEVSDEPGAERGPRLARFHAGLRVLLGKLDVVAMHWRASETIVDPIAYLGATEAAHLAAGPVTVRMFRLKAEGDVDVGLHMDTLGMAAFGLPDIECRYRGLDPDEVAQKLQTYAAYLFEKGDVLKEGDTVDGVEAKWRCRRTTASLQPFSRAVITFDPTFAHAVAMPVARAQCPGCGWVPDASSRWECDCGYMWNLFDTDAICPACDRRHTTAKCVSCKTSTPFDDWRK